MKPFNLERALAGEPVVTRDGRPVKIAGYNPDAKDGQNIAGWIGGVLSEWYHNGTYTSQFLDTNQCDLFMAPTERKEWIVRCVFGDAVWCEGPFPTEDAAIIYAADNNELRSVYEITIHE
jgi:hypothetical protein